METQHCHRKPQGNGGGGAGGAVVIGTTPTNTLTDILMNIDR